MIALHEVSNLAYRAVRLGVQFACPSPCPRGDTGLLECSGRACRGTGQCLRLGWIRVLRFKLNHLGCISYRDAACISFANVARAERIVCWSGALEGGGADGHGDPKRHHKVAHQQRHARPQVYLPRCERAHSDKHARHTLVRSVPFCQSR